MASGDEAGPLPGNDPPSPTATDKDNGVSGGLVIGPCGELQDGQEEEVCHFVESSHAAQVLLAGDCKG